jgi:hypothetical protein
VIRAQGCLLLALAVAAPARADFEAGVAAARAGDYATALREWQPLAESGNRDAQFNLGLLYENGLGVARDDASALAWYRRAAERGDAGAQYNVGEFYAFGRGVAPNDVLAVAWITVAEESGAPKTDLLDTLRRHMSPSHLEEAKRLAEDVRRQCRVD